MFIGYLNAFMKCHDPLISIQQKLAMCYVPFWTKLGKNCKKKVIFFYLLGGQVAFVQNWSIKISSSFLRCNQCIKRLLLSSQTLPSGNFHFSLCKAVPLLGRFIKTNVPTCLKLVEIQKTRTFLETVEQKECNDTW